MQARIISSAHAQDDAIEDSLLRQIVDVIVRESAPEAIVLFGSRARGNVHPDSDVDLLVVEKEPFTPQRSRRKEVARLQLALRNLPLSKDILVYSRDEFEHWRHSLNHLIGRAEREGRILHGRL